MKKKRLLFCVLLIAVMAVMTLVACKDKVPEDDLAVMGTYYHDAAGGQEYQITLNTGHKFDFSVRGDEKTGDFRLNKETDKLTLTVNKKEAIEATYKNQIITLTYKSEEMTFVKKITYKVTFDSNQGSSVSEDFVINGRTLSKPTAPTKSGHYFLGWFSDVGLTIEYDFNKPVTGEKTLYAKWLELIPSEIEFMIRFDLNYQDATANPPEQLTINGGKLIGAPTPTRDNHDFKGWWISFYDDGDMVAYPATMDTVFKESCTVYALWQNKASIAPKLIKPIPYIDGNSVKWDPITGASSYSVVVKGPSGFTTINDQIDGDTIRSVPFSTSPKGDYEIIVKAISAVSSNSSDEAARHYKNKAMPRVSIFEVKEAERILVFNEIENADKYLITVECGDENHSHAHNDVDSEDPFYDFSNCAMIPGGIKFTVKAECGDYVTSTSNVFIYEKTMAKVTNFNLDSDTQILSWKSVEGATSYVVSVSCGENAHGHTSQNIGNKTSYNLSECSPKDGGIIINVTPVARAFNSPAASEHIFNKTNLATPRDISFNGNVISWKEVPGASSYDVRIDDETPHNVTAPVTSFDLSTLYFEPDSDYDVTVRAKGTQPNSLWSGTTPISTYLSAPTYSENYARWNNVLGAEYYEVSLNGVLLDTVTTNSAKIKFSTEGINTIAVRAFGKGEYSNAKTVDVTAYVVEFRSSGDAVTPQYYAIGDKVSLPTATKKGYTIAGWYLSDSPTATKYEDGTVFTGQPDFELFAHWSRNTYTVTLNLAGGTGITQLTISVPYDQGYFLGAPTIDNGTGFAGWWSEPDGGGTRLTDECGNSLEPWTEAKHTTVYAYYVEMFSFFLLNDGTYSVKGLQSGLQYVSTANIPDKYKDKPVTILEGYAFDKCLTITTINIPASISYIERTAFNGSPNIATINVDTASKYFESDEGLLFRKEYTDDGTPVGVELLFYPWAKPGPYAIPQGTTTISNNVFTGRTGITSITIPNTVIEIANAAFSGCTGLLTVTFAADDESNNSSIAFGTNIFQNCTALATVNLSKRINNLQLNFFTGCTDLQKIIVAQGHTTYSDIDGVLFSADGKKLIYYPLGGNVIYTIPDDVTTIGEYAFAGNSKLTTVTIKPTVTTIEKGAFLRCFALANVNIQSDTADRNLIIGATTTVSSTPTTAQIEEGVFAYCTGLVSIVIPKRVITLGNFTFFSNEKLTTVTFADNSKLETIAHSAFSTCPKLTGIILPAKLKTIGISAFAKCIGITSIIIPGSVTNLYDYAFDDCSGLENIDFDEHTQTGMPTLSFGTEVFRRCSKLETMVLPAHLDNIGPGIFRGCTGIDEIIVDKDNKFFQSIGGVLFDKETVGGVEGVATTLIFFPFGKSGPYTIPDGIKYIADMAFYGHTGITEVTIANSVISIGKQAFGGTSTGTFLRTVNFKSGGTDPLDIGEKAFEYATLLTEITFPERTRIIGTSAFQYCYSLSSVYIPNTVINIGYQAFIYCYGLVSVTFEDEYDKEDDRYGTEENLVIGRVNTNGSVDGSVFYECRSLQSIEIPARTTVLGGYAFYQSYSLSSVIFKENSRLTVIRDSTFSYCYSLTEIILPEGITKLEGLAFSYCYVLEKIALPASLEVIVTAGASMNTDDRGAFYELKSLDKIILNEDNKHFIVDKDGPDKGVLFDINKTKLLRYPVNKAGDYTIPGTVMQIENRAFEYSKGLDTLTIPASVSQIGVYVSTQNYQTNVFLNSGVKKIVFKEGSGVEVLRHSVFAGCANLTEINIPEGVTTMHRYVFNGCSSLSNIPLPKSLTNMSDGYAFSGCSGLEEIDLTYVEYMGASAFSNCTALKKVTIGAALKGASSSSLTIAAAAFDGCSSLTEFDVAPLNERYQDISGVLFNKATVGGTTGVATQLIRYPHAKIATYTIPDTVTTINASAFKGSIGLKGINIPSNVTTINANAFEACNSLISVVIPATVQTWGTYVFARCTALEEVIFGAGAASKIPAQAFVHCTSLESVVFQRGSNVTEIGSAAFGHCSALETITIPKTITTIAANAFNGLGDGGSGDMTRSPESKLREVRFESGSNLQAIPSSAFNGCINLEIIELPGSITTIGSSAFQNCSKLESIVIPEKVEVIESSTFNGCTNLTTVNLPVANAEKGIKGINTIAATAFQNCVNLTDFALPATLGSRTTGTAAQITASKTIGANAFNGCASLEEVIIPDGIETIGNSAFQGCTSLERLHIADTVTLIGTDAFSGCSELKEVFIPGNVSTLGTASAPSNIFGDCDVENIGLAGNNITFVTDDGVLFNATKTVLYSFPAARTGRYEVPSSVLTLAPSSFKGSKLTEIVLPSGLTSIGNYAFQNCTELATLTIPIGVTSIGNYAFQNCTSLIKMDIPNSVVNTAASGGTYLFSGCENLQEVSWGNSMQYITNYAFLGCTNLTKVDMPLTLVGIGTSAFQNCTSLTKISIPDGVSALSASAFAGCSNLTNVTLNKSLRTINASVFADCINLETLDIPSTVTTIGASAFKGCGKLDGITIPNVVSTLGVSVFEDCVSLSAINTVGLVTTVPDRAFAGCIELESIVLTSRVSTIGVDAFAGCIKLNDIKLPRFTTTINSGAFSGCVSIKNLIIPYGVTSIGASAFDGWTDEQNIHVVGRTVAPATWSAQWKLGCDAVIDWNYILETDD